jgi:murein DD-endopeptidase MepM/ murein hydrolase activator NlpD
VSRFRQVRGRMKRFAENAQTRFSHPLHGHSVSQHIFYRATVFAVLLFVVNSVSTTNAYDVGGAPDLYDNLSIDNSSLGLIADAEGYLTKTMTGDGVAQYTNRGDEWVSHEVMPGDTLSVIAYRYDLSQDTLKWANPTIGNGSLLKVGQELKVPPSNGYTVEVGSGDTLQELFDKYYEGEDDAKEDALARTLAVNGLSSADDVSSGDDIFIVDGEKPYTPTYVASETRTTTTTTSYSETRVAPADGTYDVVASGNWFQPTSGTITQWYNWGHYAIDISDTSMPPNVAVRDGVVTRAESDGGWHGGYGNVITIDHGQTELGNCQSLYAHNSEVYVSVGDTVSGGQAIGRQGRTGRVYGRTGIHLHVEMICDGVKINPKFLFGY